MDFDFFPYNNCNYSYYVVVR